MVLHVLGNRQKFQIRSAVVLPIAVDVVYHFALVKPPPYLRFDDRCMFLPIFAVHSNVDISLFVRISASLPVAVLLLRPVTVAR